MLRTRHLAALPFAVLILAILLGLLFGLLLGSSRSCRCLLLCRRLLLGSLLHQRLVLFDARRLGHRRRLRRLSLRHRIRRLSLRLHHRHRLLLPQ